ncbi:MAG: peptide/nickel transport system substrate-binding protein [Rhodospirillaceae bacterium]|jgi:peptide/nickel transport system substrate-binding protein|nr:peptide/nickel transport system substrate-binding protein [Rhodospirillaceae bacterium]
MARMLNAILAGIVVVLALAPLRPAAAQKSGGVLKIFFFDSPASMSIHEESTIAGQGPMMGVFNNLVMYDQSVPQSGLKSIVPDLASAWSWDESGTAVTFKLRQGVKWHDGKPFTARDVKCTWDLLQGKGSETLRVNPRKTWYGNLDTVFVKADDEVTFKLKRPQPAFLALLASGFSPVYPCHVPPAEMRRRPVGTGPFKFVEFKPNELIRVARNPNYWKPGRPYLDGIEYTIIKNQSTGALSFVAGTVDMTSPYFLQVPMLADIKAQVPQASCALVPTNVQRNVMINREALPFNKPDMRRAVALTLDRRAFIETLTQGKGDIGGALLAPPEGIWGMPAELMQKLPGYDPDVEKNRSEARKIMESAGYGPGNRLKLKVSTRNIPPYRDPAVILLDQLKRIYIDAELELLDTTAWYPKVRRRDYTIGANLTGNGIDDPDQAFYENYACDSESNYDGYCNPEIDKLFDQQSMEADQDKRRKMVWDIERRLAEDVARPVLYHNRSGTCWHPYVKNYVPMVNSIYNGLRMEDVWLDK